MRPEDIKHLAVFHAKYDTSEKVVCCEWCHKQVPSNQVGLVPIDIDEETGMAIDEDEPVIDETYDDREPRDSDVNTELLTIQVKCTSCNEVVSTTICAESLDSDYTLNEDGETYTSLYGECAECLTDESDEDRLERQAQAHLEAAALHRDDPLF
jgi:hypothetical protein